MGTGTINKNNRLFWLGRYTERVYQGVENIRKIQDNLLDDIPVDIATCRRKVGIVSTTFATPEEFCQRYGFDRTLQESLLCSADSMLGNGMVLREVLGSQTLSYIQMTVSALEAASKSNSNDIQLQWAMDDIMAFRGSYAEFIDEEEIRNTIRCGASIERIDTFLRFDVDYSLLEKELNKLIHRLNKTHLEHDEEKLAFIHEFLTNEGKRLDRFDLLHHVDTLVQV